MITDSNGNPVARHDYLPFGVEIPAGFAGRTSAWATTDNLSAKFTAQERDTETGLDLFQARYHGSAQGRFLSPDPLGNFVADPTNP
jgi:RHS repeat-associated protein